MDQVTNFLESIIAVELPDVNPVEQTGEKMKLPSPIKARRSSSSTSIEKEPNNANVSSFWYLEDDHKKVANQMTDKLIESVLNVIIDPSLVGPSTGDTRYEIHQTRPQFSINLMTLNSIKFAQRISPVFTAIDDATYMMCWKDPYLTIGILLMATLVILHPVLVTIIPPFMLLKYLLVPSYLKLHLPDYLFVDDKLTFQNPIPADGAPLDKFEPPKPVPQLSREFLMNFTDMQNHLVPYIRLYDAAISWGQHYFLYEDTNLSTVVFLILWIVIISNLFIFPLVAPLLSKVISPRLLVIVFLWAFFFGLHPHVRGRLLDQLYTEEARVSRLNKTDKLETRLMGALVPEPDIMDIDESREVEVFELHRLSRKHIWEPVGFTNSFFTLNDPLRIRKVAPIVEDSSEKFESPIKADEDGEEKMVFPELPRKATLSEIKAPENWKFTAADWQIDYEPMKWVSANFIMDLVSVDTDEKWVYDYVDGDKAHAGHTYRRRRWTRNCQRETTAERKAREIQQLGAASTSHTDRLGKTISTLLN